MPFSKEGKTNFKYILIVVILGFIVSVGIIRWVVKQEIPLAELPEMEKAEKEDIRLTLEELKNTEYYTNVFEETVQLEDGFYFRPWLPDSATGLRVEILDDKIAFGDLNDDEKEDAAVIVYSSGGGSGGFRDLAVMINEEGKPSYFTSKFLGDRVMINSITIQSRVVTLDMVVHGPKDGLCCPSVEKTFKYELSDNQLVEVMEDETAKKEKEVIIANFDCDEKDEETGWSICKNEDYKFEFKKPEDFSWVKNLAIITDCNYVNFQEDCSDVDDLILAFEKETGCSASCLEAMKHNLSFWGEKYRIIINKSPFCVYESHDCGAGSCGAEYYHLTIKEKDCCLIYSHYWRTNCSTHYGLNNEDYRKCVDEQENEDKVFEEVISTFKFLE